MAADPTYNASKGIYRKDGMITVSTTGVIDFITGGKMTFNSTQLPAVEAATTAATSSLAGAITAINTLGGLVNSIKSNLINIGLMAST